MAGNFLSRPKRDGPGECDTNEKMGLSYGVIGVQGWRLSMEDAHICICDLKEHCESILELSPDLLSKIPDQSSLFAVFDGHGGEEVAILSSRKFPKFLVEDENFLRNDFEAALKSTYMRMDAYIKCPEGQQELQEILEHSARSKENEEEDEDEEEEEDDNEDDEMENGDHDSDEEIRTGDCDDDNEEGVEEDDEEAGDDAISEGTGQLLNSLISGGFLTFLADRTKQMKEELKALGDDDDDDEDDFNPDDVTSSEGEDEDDDGDEEGEGEDDECDEEVIKSENDESEEKSNGGEANGQPVKTETDTKVEENGKAEEKQKLKVDSSGDSAHPNKDEDTGDETQVKAKSSKRKKSPKKLVAAAKDAENEDDNEMENGKDDSETEEDDDSLVTLEEDALMEKPGFDSGCTAVVALKIASRLFVANAGDSRCVLSVNSIATPLSNDHNPSVPEEVARVEAAGGKIEAGRVDGGLNLTRAFGDHRYKQNSELPPEKQRISAEAEVTVTDLVFPSSTENGTSTGSSTDISPDFFVVACDGIWECLENEKVVSEVSEGLSSQNLFEICQKMTEKCIAPSSRGSQTTGLDNMTIIVVTLQPHKLTSKFVHEPRKKLKSEKGSETTTNGKLVPENGESNSESDINSNGVSDSNANLSKGKEALLSGVEATENSKSSDLKRPLETSFENRDAQNCKVLKTE